VTICAIEWLGWASIPIAYPSERGGLTFRSINLDRVTTAFARLRASAMRA